MNIAVYGTLRRGLPNHSFFKEGLEFLQEIILKGYNMYDFSAMPLVTETGMPNHKIKCELFYVSSKKISRQIDAMELQAGYFIDNILIEEHPYKIYVYPHCPKGGKIVGSGDWKKYAIKNNLYPNHVETE